MYTLKPAEIHMTIFTYKRLPRFILHFEFENSKYKSHTSANKNYDPKEYSETNKAQNVFLKKKKKKR